MLIRLSSSSAGYICGVAAFGLWAVLPVYLKLFQDVPPQELLAHRVIWTAPVCAAILLAGRRLGGAIGLWRSLPVMRLLICSTILMALQWAAYLWAVLDGRVLEASLGYFLSPLVSVLIGTLLFREQLRPLQWMAVALAGIAVVMALTVLGQVPYFGLVMAVTFSAYGAVRKLAKVEAVSGLLTEVMLLLPLAGGYLLWSLHTGTAAFLAQTVQTDLLLMAAGIVTAVPLILFGAAATRLPVSSTGMLIYITPSGLFLLAILAYGEPITSIDMLVFGLIWAALILFTLEGRLQALSSHGWSIRTEQSS